MVRAKESNTLTKYSLVHAKKARNGSRDLATLTSVSTSALDGGEWSKSPAIRFISEKKHEYALEVEVGWAPVPPWPGRV